VQTLPTLPPDFKGANTAAEIAVAPEGRELLNPALPQRQRRPL
jgi:6-phosphogluconolactonase (cycloisomerase 2 family)